MGDTPSSEWQGIICRHGLLLVQGDARRSLQKSVMMKGGVFSDDPFTASQALEAKTILIGAPRDSLLLAKETGDLAQPPLRLVLSDAVVEALRRPAFQRAVAMTHSGPRDPDKPCNQDFAVAADLSIGGKAFSVAVVCDGVSQKVFWPERSSRIAGLASLEALYDFLSRGSETSFPEMLQAAITKAYREDRQLLGETPSLMFDPEYYARQREREANWYQTTVLVAALGGDGGFVSFVGDGAIVDMPRVGKFDQKLETTEDFGLDHCASLLFQAHEFSAAIRFDPGERTLMLATDGIDRTALASGSREEFFHAVATRVADANQKARGEALFNLLEQTSQLPYCASDNISIAWLTAPDARAGGEVIRAHGGQLDPPAAPPPPPPAPPPPPQPAQQAFRPAPLQPAGDTGRSPPPYRPTINSPHPPRSPMDDHEPGRRKQRRKKRGRVLDYVLIGASVLLLMAVGYMLAAIVWGSERSPVVTAQDSQPDKPAKAGPQAGGREPEARGEVVTGTPDEVDEKLSGAQGAGGPVTGPVENLDQRAPSPPASGGAEGKPTPAGSASPNAAGTIAGGSKTPTGVAVKPATQSPAPPKPANQKAPAQETGKTSSASTSGGTGTKESGEPPKPVTPPPPAETHQPAVTPAKTAPDNGGEP